MTLAAPSTAVTQRQQPRWRRMVPPVAVASGLAAATIALHLRDPHARGAWGMCPSAAMGFDCPGCGGLRAVNDLSNLDLGAAASSNLVFVAALPLIAYLFFRWGQGRWSGRRWQPGDRALGRGAIVLAIVLVAFTVLRNLPAGSWLAA